MKKRVITMNSSLKGAAKAITSSKINNSGPAIGKAIIEIQRDGAWLAAVKCLNGDPRRNLETTIPAGTSFADGSRLPEKGEVTVLLSDGRNIDTNLIFPWQSDLSTQRLGGHGKGHVLEGAQDPGRTGPTIPITWPHVHTFWINGTVVKETIVGSDTLGHVFFPGDHVFFSYVINERGDTEIKVLAPSEGDCLTLGPEVIEVKKPGPDPLK